VLRQDHYAFDRFRVIDTAIMGNQRLWNALEERDVLYTRPDLSDEEGMRLAELEGIVGEEDGYTAESDAAILLHGLDIPDALHGKTMAELQGGQKVRVLLAQALFGHPAALLLDEPTNHLDLESINALNVALQKYAGTVLLVTHDQELLEEVGARVWHFDDGRIVDFKGSYEEVTSQLAIT
jgi:ATPase subunit of ABC transporter with duplicated ATPase domains